MGSANKFQQLLARHRESGITRHIMGVHDCVSAKLAEAAGYEAVWISSLGMSAVAGKCDRNEISWTNIADMVELIAESCDVPVIIDGNEGFGDTAIARLFATRAAARGGSGICFEDKTYPKRNSFADGVELCSIDEFSRKISSCRDALAGMPASIMARTDSLVANEGMSKALERAQAYAEAGVDAVIVLSKTSSVDQLAEFMSRWKGYCPIISVPTSFDQTSPKVFNEIGVACVIWANQLLRASIFAMRQACKQLREQGRVGDLNGQMISVKEALLLANCGLGCTNH